MRISVVSSLLHSRSILLNQGHSCVIMACERSVVLRFSVRYGRKQVLLYSHGLWYSGTRCDAIGSLIANSWRSAGGGTVVRYAALLFPTISKSQLYYSHETSVVTNSAFVLRKLICLAGGLPLRLCCMKDEGLKRQSKPVEIRTELSECDFGKAFILLKAAYCAIAVISLGRQLTLKLA